MNTYALLANPGHNRVYFQGSKTLSLAELALLSPSLSVPCFDFDCAEYGGILYYTWQCNAPLPQDDIDKIYNASSAYALFAITADETFKPLSRQQKPLFDEKLTTLLKYTGKTNELFTKLLVNIAVCTHGGRPKTLFDPVAGKGTTLFEGLSRGLSVFGCEIAEAAAQDGIIYFKKFLETEKIKHKTHTEKRSGTGYKSKISHFILNHGQVLAMATGNSRFADSLFGKRKFDLIVGDLPYGVAHGNVGRVVQSGKTRNPRELLTECLPSWLATLKPNGVMVLAWNTHVFSRASMLNILTEHGLQVQDQDVYAQFTHRVDQAILRDIVVAKKQ